MHVLPLGRLAPVYQTDMKHPGIVKPFRDISDSELEEYTALASSVVAKILAATGLDVLHCNHMAMQPTIARVACAQLAATTGACATQFIVFPHGSAIEFTLRPDERYRALALEAILSPHCAGMISGNHEVLNRILRIYPEAAEAIVAKTRIVGVGTDTTLFQPIDRSARSDAMAQLLAAVTAQNAAALAAAAAPAVEEEAPDARIRSGSMAALLSETLTPRRRNFAGSLTHDAMGAMVAQIHMEDRLEKEETLAAARAGSSALPPLPPATANDVGLAAESVTEGVGGVALSDKETAGVPGKPERMVRDLLKVSF